MKNSKIDLGPVKVERGRHKGRIANLDDCETPATGVCYFGSIIFHGSMDRIQLRYLRNVTTDDLWSRKEELAKLLNAFSVQFVPDDEKLDFFYEYYYIYNILEQRWNFARFAHKNM